jgi:hypothetical protein
MAALTVAGIALEIADGGEDAPVFLGEVSDSFSGIERNSVRGQKRVFSFITAPTVEATWDTLRAAVAEGAQVTCSGVLLSGDTITGRVQVSAKLETGTASARFTITGTIREVAP